jgi:hypothetical protein
MTFELLLARCIAILLITHYKDASQVSTTLAHEFRPDTPEGAYLGKFQEWGRLRDAVVKELPHYNEYGQLKNDLATLYLSEREIKDLGYELIQHQARQECGFLMAAGVKVGVYSNVTWGREVSQFKVTIGAHHITLRRAI